MSLKTTNLKIAIPLCTVILFNGCSSKNIKKEVDSTECNNINSHRFRDVILPTFNHSKIVIEWSEDDNGVIVGLKSSKVIEIISQNKKLRDEIRTIHESVSEYNRIGITSWQ